MKSRPEFQLDERLREQALAEVSQGVLICDENRRIVYANAAFSAITGYGPEELLGGTCRALQGPETDPVTLAALQAAVRAGEGFEGEILNYRKDGATFWNGLSITPVHDEAGRLIGFIGIQRDVTERWRADATLQESEQRYRLLFANMLEGYCFCRLLYEDGRARDYVYLEVNAAFAPQTGLRDVVGKRVSEVIPGIHEAVPEQLEIYSRVAETGRPEQFETYVQPIDVWFSVSVYSNEKGHFTAVFDNITARKKGERALRESEEHARQASGGLAKVLDSSLDVICTFDGEGRFILVSAACERVWGYRAEELLGTPFIDKVHPEDREKTLAVDARILSGTSTNSFENRYVRKDGTVVYMMWSASWSEADQSNFCVARDVTETRRAEAETRELADRLTTTLESLTDGFFTLDREWRITYVNRAAEEIFRLPRAELLGHPIWSRYPEAANTLFRQESERALRDDVAVKFETFYAPSDTWYEVKAFPSEQGLAVYFHDLTASREAKAATERVLQRLTEAQRIGRIGDWEWDIATQAINWSPQVFEIFGRDPDLGPPRDYEEQAPFFDAASWALLQEKVAGAISSGEVQDYELVVLRPDGGRVAVQAMAVPRKDAVGRVVGLYGTVQDITERKRTEEAMRQSEERFAGAFAHAPIGVALVSPDGRWLKVNRAVCELVGYSEAELLARTFQDITHPEDLSADLEQVRQLLAGEIGFYQMEKRYVHAHGHHVTALLNVSLVRDGRGQPGYFISQIQDITARKRTEEALRASEAEFRTLAESMPQIVWMTRPDGWNIYFSQQWMDYTGLSFEESLGYGWNRPFHPEDQSRAWDAWQHALATGGTYSLECRLRRADGVYRWWLTRGVPQRDAEGHILKWFGTCTDIHDLKLAELEISRANRALKMLSACNEALIREDDESKLLEMTCRIAVEIGGYRMAWVGYARTDESRSIQPMAHAGDENGYLSEIALSWAGDQLNGQGPAGRAIRSGKATMCDDVAGDPAFAPWREPALRRGYRSMICLPLREGHSPMGFLGLYSSETRAVPAEEVKLLQELADDLAFGIGNIRARGEARRMQEAVAEQATLLDEARDAILVRDLEHRITYWNKSAQHLYGWAKEEVIGRPVTELFSKETTAFDQAQAEFMRAGEWAGELHQTTRDGRDLIVDSRWTLVRDAAGRPKCTLVINTDVTERKKSQETLLLTAKRMELAAKAGRVGIWDWDIVTGDVHWDDQLYALYGEDPSTAVASFDFWRRHVHPDDLERIEAVIAQTLLEEGESSDTAFRILIPPDGAIRHIRAQAVVFRDPANQPVRMLGTNWDVTEQVEREEILREKLENERTLRRQASAGEKAKSEFLAVMSHEIRTPMNGILGFAEMLAQSPGLSPENRDLSQTILSSGEALLRILDDILDFSRIEAGRLAIEKEIFSPRELLQSIETLFARQVQAKGLELLVTMDEGVPASLQGDAGRIRQILVNLIGNALKFTAHGSIQASVRVSKDAAAGNALEFIVRDTGEGIALDRAQAIFEAFTQADSSTTRRHGGTGLGLTISRRLAELMGGTLQMNSQLGEGTAFTLLVPFTLAGPPIEIETVSDGLGLAVQADFALRHPQRILVVEDDRVNLKLIVSMLRRLGYQPLAARNGVEAVAIYKLDDIDCILMDVQMPEMDGIEATREIRNLERARALRAAYISALTANILPEDQRRCLNAGMNAYLNKPVKNQAIVSLLVEAWKFRQTETG